MTDRVTVMVVHQGTDLEVVQHGTASVIWDGESTAFRVDDMRADDGKPLPFPPGSQLFVDINLRRPADDADR